MDRGLGAKNFFSLRLFVLLICVRFTSLFREKKEKPVLSPKVYCRFGRKDLGPGSQGNKFEKNAPFRPFGLFSLRVPLGCFEPGRRAPQGQKRRPKRNETARNLHSRFFMLSSPFPFVGSASGALFWPEDSGDPQKVGPKTKISKK